MQNKTKKRTDGLTDYNRSNMSKLHYMLVYAVAEILAAAVLYVFYKNIIASAIVGAFLVPTLAGEYVRARIKKRKKKLRVQFCDMLESMSVSARAGNNELKSLESAYRDLQRTYSEGTDILVEVDNILRRNENGVPLRNLFKDFGERSGVEDIRSFGEIYEIIEGKSDRFADIIKQTQQIISDKVEIEEEIETVLTAPKSENKIMLVMPVMLVLMMGGEGGLLDWLYTNPLGFFVITASVGVFAAAYIIGQHMTDIEV